MAVRLFVVTCVVSLVSCFLGFPLSEDTKGDESTTEVAGERLFEEGDLFEGDIILRPDQLARLKTKDLPEGSIKTLIADPTAIWPDKTVPYEFAPGEFSSVQQARILEALNDIMTVSCVRFVPRTNQAAYLVLRNNGLGCAAAVGYHNFGPLDLFLGGPSCQTRGTIQHEFLHALGFWHEHTRQDRDDHITILWNNISPGKEFNFYKRDPSEIMTLNTPYDYNSVMHYRAIAFSKDMRNQTIVPKMPTAASRMGQRIRFSQVDLAKLNRFYQCPPTYYHGEFSVTYKNSDEKNKDVNPATNTEVESELLQHIVKKEPSQSQKDNEMNKLPVGVKIDFNTTQKTSDVS